MDLTPQQLDSVHEGYTALTTPPDKADRGGSGHSTRKRPGK